MKYDIQFPFILNDHLIGPSIIAFNFTDDRYLELLRDEIMPTLRQIINPEGMQNIFFRKYFNKTMDSKNKPIECVRDHPTFHRKFLFTGYR